MQFLSNMRFVASFVTADFARLHQLFSEIPWKTWITKKDEERRKKIT